MAKHCKECGTANAEEARYCGKCGGALHPHGHERIHENQVAEAGLKAKHLLLSLSLDERIIGIGALVSLLSFILPWASMGWESVDGFTAASNDASYLYLLPILMIASLVLLYVARSGHNLRETLIVRWQIVIGSVAAVSGVAVIIFIMSLSSMFGSASAGVGLYLYILGAIAIAVGAFRRQHALPKHNG